VIAFVPWIVAGCTLGFNNSESRTVELPADLSVYRLVSPAGDLVFRTGAEVGVEATVQWRGSEAPVLQADEQSGSVDHDWSCDRRCAIDLTVTLPDAMERIDVDLEVGDVDVAGLTGDLGIAVETGRIDVDGHTGDVGLTGGAGAIVARGLDADDAMATTGTGRIELALVRRPAVVTAEAGTGDVDVVVPAGAYALDVSTGVGSVNIDSGIREDDGADASITATAGAGSVSIESF